MSSTVSTDKCIMSATFAIVMLQSSRTIESIVLMLTSVFLSWVFQGAENLQGLHDHLRNVYATRRLVFCLKLGPCMLAAPFQRFLLEFCLTEHKTLLMRVAAISVPCWVQ